MQASLCLSARVLLGTALIGVAAGAFAHGDHESTEHRPTESTAVGARVAIDPVTRQLRAPNAEELRQLNLSAAAVAPGVRLKSTPMMSKVPGARGVALGAEHLSYSLAVRKADGSIDMECLTGEQLTQAQKALQAKGADLE